MRTVCVFAPSLTRSNSIFWLQVMLNIDIQFSGTVNTWHGGKATWFYVVLPLADSDEIKTLNKVHAAKRRGFGGIRVTARIEKTEWQTSIFPAFDGGIYTLFLKAEVRKQENIGVGDQVKIALSIQF